MYKLIDKYKQQVELEYNQIEIDKRNDLENNWNELLRKSNNKFDQITHTESHIKDQLLGNIKQLKEKIIVFKREYETKGPKQEGLEPKIAANLLTSFKEQ